MMKVVGDYLHQAAKTQQLEFDPYARSAFNRYYYACFLIAREMYARIHPGKGIPSHKQLPSVISTTLGKRIAKSARESARNGSLSEGQSRSISSTALTRSIDLANILNEGYQVRCTADYEPDVLVRRDGTKFHLGKTSLETAARWPDRAGSCASAILSVWRQLGN
jgi:hypothetical protein